MWVFFFPLSLSLSFSPIENFVVKLLFTTFINNAWKLLLLLLLYNICLLNTLKIAAIINRSTKLKSNFFFFSRFRVQFLALIRSFFLASLPPPLSHFHRSTRIVDFVSCILVNTHTHAHTHRVYTHTNISDVYVAVVLVDLTDRAKQTEKG